MTKKKQGHSFNFDKLPLNEDDIDHGEQIASLTNHIQNLEGENTNLNQNILDLKEENANLKYFILRMIIGALGGTLILHPIWILLIMDIQVGNISKIFIWKIFFAGLLLLAVSLCMCSLKTVGKKAIQELRNLKNA